MLPASTQLAQPIELQPAVHLSQTPAYISFVSGLCLFCYLASSTYTSRQLLRMHAGSAQQGPFRSQATTRLTPTLVDAPHRPSKAAVARAARIVRRHVSAGLREVSPLCHAYAEHALSVWRLCPGISLLTNLSTDASADSICTGTVAFNIVVQRAAPRGADADASVGGTTHRTADSLSTGFPGAGCVTMDGLRERGEPRNPYARVERALARDRSPEEAEGAPALLHHNFVAAVLADVYGIQVCGRWLCGVCIWWTAFLRRDGCQGVPAGTACRKYPACSSDNLINGPTVHGCPPDSNLEHF